MCRLSSANSVKAQPIFEKNGAESYIYNNQAYEWYSEFHSFL